MSANTNWPGQIEEIVAAIIQKPLELSETELERLRLLCVEYDSGVKGKEENFNLKGYDAQFSRRVDKVKKSDPVVGYAYDVLQVMVRMWSDNSEAQLKAILEVTANFFKI